MRSIELSLTVMLVFLGFFSMVSWARSETTLARIDEARITVDDFDNYLKLFPGESTFAQCDDKTRGIHLENLINRRLLLEEARRLSYFEAPESKSHSRLDQGEKEAFALRKLLSEKIVKPGTASREAIERYQAEHAADSYAVAETELNHRLRRQLFDDLILQLRKTNSIEIYENNQK